ncbi:MAG: hypothetical protein K2X25_15490 [Caulobacteraceae bacterium]|nr:hypothetical protein [Caulobacteraceae bacterium]
MKTRTVISVAALALATAACASGSGGRFPTYSEDLNRLTEECRARGGLFTPIPGANTGRPQTDYACRITGGASRLD